MEKLETQECEGNGISSAETPLLDKQPTSTTGDSRTTDNVSEASIGDNAIQDKSTVVEGKGKNTHSKVKSKSENSISENSSDLMPSESGEVSEVSSGNGQKSPSEVTDQESTGNVRHKRMVKKRALDYDDISSKSLAVEKNATESSSVANESIDSEKVSKFDCSFIAIYIGLLFIFIVFIFYRSA